ncbi:MAG TPA: hypothetical protein VF752_05270 [Thermoleophilaceae bacterium]
MRLRLSISALLGLALLLAAAAPAGALIHVQKGIAGVRIGMTQQQMKDVLGKPRSAKQGSNDFGPYTQFIYPGRIAVTFQGNRRVTGIYTSGTKERTADGVGVGSSERLVKRKVEDVVCETIGSAETCHVGNFDPGHRVTVFLFKDDRVKRVTIGLVLD